MTTTDLTTDIRRQYGITVTLTSVPVNRTLEYSGEIRHSGGAVETFGPVEGLAGRVQLLADLNYRATELVEFAAMQHEDFAVLPDATPTDAEAEAAQRELVELERQAGVAECRPDYLAGWCAACDGTGLVVGPDRDVYDCPTCGAPPEAGGLANPLPTPPAAEVLGEGHSESASRYAWIDIRGWGWGAEPAPVVTRDAPTTLPHLWGWRSANRRGAEHGQRESGHGPLLSLFRDHDYAPPSTADCPACGGSGLNDEPCKDAAGNFYRRYRPCFVHTSAPPDPEPTTNDRKHTPTDEEIHQAHLADLLERELKFLALSLTCPTDDEARYNELAAEARREYDAIKYAQPHQIAKLNREREESRRPPLPFQERQHAA